MTLDALAESFGIVGAFVQQFSQSQMVHGLETTFMVLLGHDLQADFDALVASVSSMQNSTRRQSVELAKRLQEALMEFARHGADQ